MTGLRIAPNLELPLDAVTGTFAILATKGAGKSNAGVVMAEEMYDAGIPWVAVDPKGDWHGLRSSADGNGPGLPIVVFGGRHGDVPLEPTAGVLLADLVLNQRLSCVLDVSQFTKADVTRFLLAFGRHLFTHADDDGAEPLHLFLEEAHEYLPQSVRGDQAELVGVWQRIVKQGRFKGLGCTMISQRSSVLNKDVLELIDTLIVLRTIGPRSRDSIKEWVRDQDVDPALMASLPGLADGEAWVWSPGALRILQRVHFRRRRTFDSGATPKVGQKRRVPKTVADVDLAAIKEQMADTIERAKADDPKELRRRIRDLEKQLTERPTEPVEVQVPVEVPVLDPELVSRIEAAAGPLTDGVQVLIDYLTQTRQELAVWQGYTTQLQRTSAPEKTTRAPVTGRPSGNRGPATTAHPPAANPSARAPRERRPAGDGTTSDIGKGERIILTAIAQYDAGVTPEQLTVLTGYKRSSRNTYLQRLKQAGLITPDGARLVATDAGIDVLGDDYEPLPTGAALRAHVLATLPEGERRILTELIDAYPNAVSRDDLSERTGYKRSSRNTYLQRMRARELIIVTGEQVTAIDTLFDEGR